MIIINLFLINLIFTKCENELIYDRSVHEDDPKLFHGYLLKKMIQTIPNIVQKWKIFKKKFDLKFSGHENKLRFFTYAKASIFVYEFMKDNSSTFEVAENHLSHLTREEYFVLLGRVAPEEKSTIEEIQTLPELETRQASNSKDWRKFNVVSSIKDQGQCGSCYTFSTITTLESAIAIKTGKLYDLSEQQIVDCTYSLGNNGCKGGLEEKVFKYMKENSVTNETLYPYQAYPGICRKVPGFAPKLRSYYRIPNGDERALARTLINLGPVTIAMDARFDSYKYFKSGILREPRCSKDILGHSMALIGVTDAYYIVKNSWSTSYGINGYLHVARNAGNVCGIASDAILPLL